MKQNCSLKHLAPMMIFCSFLATGHHGSAQTAIPDYAGTDRKDIPVGYTWKIEDIFRDVDAWQEEKAEVAVMIRKIPAMAPEWTAYAKNMLAFEEFTDKISLKLERLYAYASHQSNMDAGNTQFRAMEGEVQALSVDYGAQLAFVQPDLIKLGAAKFDEYAKQEPKLETYRFPVEQVLRMKDHVLPEDQQKIVSMTGLFSSAPREAASVLNNLEIPYAKVTLAGGKEVELNMANFMEYRRSKDRADRSLVMNAFWNNHKKFQNTLAILLNGAMKQHFFSAKTATFDNCLQARLYPENIDTAVYMNLIASVNQHLGSLHRFLQLKQKMLGLKDYRYDDIYASAVRVVDKKYSWDEAEKAIKGALEPMGPEYAAVLKRAFTERWIDIYPNKGKESGAYSSGMYGIHPFIKMNYNGDYDAVSTLAHELGHAVHSFFSDENQAYVNSDYATFLAEIASTFNENLLMNYLLKHEQDDLFKLYILDSYLDGVRATIFRQTLFAEFELAMHRRVEEGQSLTADWLNRLYLSLTRKYYGHATGVMQVDEYIQYEWSIVPHFYMNYYVFQYSTGMIASMALSEKVLTEGAPARGNYLGMLKSGGKDYPLNLLKSAGVDMTTPEPTTAAMRNFDRLTEEMEKLYNRLRQQGKM